MGNSGSKVERKFVPNCSLAIVTKITQKPVEIPERTHNMKNIFTLAPLQNRNNKTLHRVANIKMVTSFF